MPTATEELRNKMGEYFGERILEHFPMKFLEDAGYVLTRGWVWKPKPGVECYDDMTQKEYDCMEFLVQEWDFGGLEPSKE